MMTSRNWDAIPFLFKKTIVLKLSPTLSTQKMLLTLCFSHQQNIPSPKCPPFSFSSFLPSYLLTFYTHTPLIIWASWVPSPSAPKSSPSAWKTHPHYFSCTYEASSLPSVFSLLYHQESIWIRGGLKGTQNKAQNGPTTLPKTDLELMGLGHVGFGSQNYQNQCFTPADSMNRLNRLNRMPTGRTGCKKIWKFDRMFLEEWGIHEKNGTQFRVRKREIWSK